MKILYMIEQTIPHKLIFYIYLGINLWTSPLKNLPFDELRFDINSYLFDYLALTY